MKILQVSNFFKPLFEAGGVARSVYSISKSLVDMGHEVTIYTTYPANRNISYANIKTNRPLNIEGMKIYYFSNLREYFPMKIPPVPYYLPIVARREMKNFDIIHIHEYRTILAAVVHFYARKYGIPYIFQPRGSLPRIMEKQNLKKLYDVLWGYKLVKDASKLIALTSMEIDQFKKMNVDNDKIEILPNGVNFSKFRNLPKKGQFRKKYGLSISQNIVLFIGRIHKIKGVDLLVESFADVADKMDDVKLVIVGPDDGYVSVLKKLIKELNVEDKIIFTGPLYGKNKLEAYVDSDVYVLPSIYETFPNTVLEACACGKPVIVTDRCGIADMINKIGCVVEYDKDQLKYAILNILGNAELENKFGNESRKLVQEEFDWDKIILNLEKIYLNLVEQ